MSYPSPYLKTKWHRVNGVVELIKETRELTIEEKAIKYDKLMETINDLERMYTNALDRYPTANNLIKEKIMVLKMIKA